MDNLLFIDVPGGGHLSVLLLFGLGAIVSVLGSFFGVGGGWILSPALNVLGVPMGHAVGTGFGYLTGMSALSTYNHRKYGHVETRLALCIGLPMMGGIEAGKRVVLLLDAHGHADLGVGLLYVVLLLGLGFFVLRDALRSGPRRGAGGAPPSKAPYLRQFRARPQVFLPQCGFYVSLWPLVVIGLGTGVLSGIMGVGGGFVLMPIMVFLMGMPTVVAVGTTMLCVLLASPFGLVTYALTGRVLFPVVGVMLAGALLGVPVGVYASRQVKGHWLRLLYGGMILAGGVSVLLMQAARMFPEAGLERISQVAILGTAGVMAGLVLLLALAARRNGA